MPTTTVLDLRRFKDGAGKVSSVGGRNANMSHETEGTGLPTPPVTAHLGLGLVPALPGGGHTADRGKRSEPGPGGSAGRRCPATTGTTNAGGPRPPLSSPRTRFRRSA